ncbi:MAG: hypothetical protein M3Y27_06515 [Acidobacteriota bacterium]|nr:hypothetical protein [Acidobacteriota bacterium]
MVCSTAFGLDPQKLTTQFAHRSWSAKDGLPGVVWAIAQTMDGYLWIGTEAGLFRFDGVRFVRWESNFGEHLPCSSVGSLCTAHDGSLWIGLGAGISQIRQVLSPVRNDRISAGFVVEPLAGMR